MANTAALINGADRRRFYEVVGERMREARKEANLSIHKVAAACGVNPSTIQNAEEGMGVSLHLFVVIAEALDTPLDALVPLEAT